MSEAIKISISHEMVADSLRQIEPKFLKLVLLRALSKVEIGDMLQEHLEDEEIAEYLEGAGELVRLAAIHHRDISLLHELICSGKNREASDLLRRCVDGVISLSHDQQRDLTGTRLDFLDHAGAAQ